MFQKGLFEKNTAAAVWDCFPLNSQLFSKYLKLLLFLN